MRVVIVGGGINGMFSAYFLRKDGYEVEVIDRSHSGKTSVFNAGLLTPALPPAEVNISRAFFDREGPLHVSPSVMMRNPAWLLSAARGGGHEGDMAELGERSLKLYRKFFKEESVEADVADGVVAVYKDEGKARDAAAAHGCKFLSGPDLREMGYAGFGGGALFRKNMAVNPPKLFDALRKKLSETGVRFVTGEEADLEVERGRVGAVSTRSGRHAGDYYVIAGGSWTTSLCRKLRYNPRIIPARGLALLFRAGGSKVVSTPALLEDYGPAVSQHDPDTVRARLRELGARDSKTLLPARRSEILPVLRKQGRAATARAEPSLIDR
ncbi:MAG: FAD-dependent oxidoreductase, partial [Nitrososphaerota archaeon]|nr:FAD-dependent oxidoreductase [Nitrososphaerota archaeon]